MFQGLSSMFGARSRLVFSLLCVTGLLALSACSSSDDGQPATLSNDEPSQETGQTAEDVTQDDVTQDEVEPADEELPVMRVRSARCPGRRCDST